MKRLRDWQRQLAGIDARVVDGGLALALTFGAQAEYVAKYEPGFDTNRLLFLIATTAIAFRRQFPIAVFAIVFAVSLAATQGVGLVIFTALLIATYSLAAHSRQAWLTLGLVLVVSVLVDVIYGGSPPPVPELAVPFAILVPIWFAGKGIRKRELRAESLADRAMRLENERETATRTAVAEERARIARELHDVVTHNVSVMVVQAGAARQVLYQQPAQAVESLLAVEASGREAMSELRRFLDLLSRDGVDAALTPQPSLERVPELVDRVREAGMTVELHVEGTPRAVPPGVDLAAYRVIQEGLTNALKYAAPAATRVVVSYGDSLLKIEVLDEGRTGGGAEAGGGRGLAGLRERVALYGGRLEAGRRLDGGYALRAYLPTALTSPATPT